MALAEATVARLNEGKAVAVHCRAGIGRSSLIAACVLVLLGLAPGTALDRIGKARGGNVPDTEGQRDWVDKFHERRRPAATIRPDVMLRGWRCLIMAALRKPAVPRQPRNTLAA
jgi:protein-tyrosine phosphatase